jgi:hypothetical protein
MVDSSDAAEPTTTPGRQQHRRTDNDAPGRQQHRRADDDAAELGRRMRRAR